MAIKKDKKTDLEPVYIPKESRNDDSLYVAVNGRRMLVKKGVQVMLPKMFAEVIKNSQKQDAAAQKYIEDNATD